ncbi:MAG: Nif3-like dinuclear metal center hexameric protein [Clostridia bacterium]|nr:Nif3-like dinuclear metal center hexameric protein [Clostridia bacterium]
MQIDELYKAIDAVAPKRISDAYCAAYDAYDNSGLLVRMEGDVQRVVFSLDFSCGAVEKAIRERAKLIVTHHPAIYGKIGSIDEGEPLGKKLISCIRNGISIVSMHLNLDLANGGIDDSLMNALGGERPVVMEEVPLGTYGKVYDVDGFDFPLYIEKIKRALETERVIGYGNKPVRRVASFCGAGIGEQAISFAKQNGADTVVSADWKHHLITGTLEQGMNAIVLTHYASECYGFKQFKNKCQAVLPVACIWHEDDLK